MDAFLIFIKNCIWGVPLIALLVGTGIYFSCKLKFLPVTHFRQAWGLLLHPRRLAPSAGDISAFASLCTALAATLGVGNIVGVALAVSVGGPGALFWMWVATFFGLAVKYAEGLLAIRYRTVGSDGKVAGGPMHYIEQGLKCQWLAKFFALCGAGGALVGIGTWTQSHAVAIAAQSSFGIPFVVTAALIALLVAAITMGGLRRIAAVSEKVVPFMAIFYTCAAICVLVLKASAIPQALASVFVGAFSPRAILGAGSGASVAMVLRIGISRGIFANESGLGSAAIAASAAKTDIPAQQGLITMLGAFLSIVVCTMTALVLLVTAPEIHLFGGHMDGGLLTSQAFGAGLSMPMVGRAIVDLGVILFAFTTILGWNYYGEKCVQYLLGMRFVLPYKLLFLFFVAVGPFWNMDMIFVVADIATGLMALPNLIGLIGLRKEIFQETKALWLTEAR
ncbi:MAG: sodium:alanine symporter family protein [Puniceicoccales bacterium]|jgi:AGCS family alanine or glycine:cation symporter|nr:sodium:alanine symporter family protein [Puniceicoccales bacterium]